MAGDQNIEAPIRHDHLIKTIISEQWQQILVNQFLPKWQPTDDDLRALSDIGLAVEGLNGMLMAHYTRRNAANLFDKHGNAVRAGGLSAAEMERYDTVSAVRVMKALMIDSARAPTPERVCEGAADIVTQWEDGTVGVEELELFDLTVEGYEEFIDKYRDQDPETMAFFMHISYVYDIFNDLLLNFVPEHLFPLVDALTAAETEASQEQAQRQGPNPTSGTSSVSAQEIRGGPPKREPTP